MGRHRHPTPGTAAPARAGSAANPPTPRIYLSPRFQAVGKAPMTSCAPPARFHFQYSWPPTSTAGLLLRHGQRPPAPRPLRRGAGARQLAAQRLRRTLLPRRKGAYLGGARASRRLVSEALRVTSPAPSGGGPAPGRRSDPPAAAGRARRCAQLVHGRSVSTAGAPRISPSSPGRRCAENPRSSNPGQRTPIGHVQHATTEVENRAPAAARRRGGRLGVDQAPESSLKFSAMGRRSQASGREGSASGPRRVLRKPFSSTPRGGSAADT